MPPFHSSEPGRPAADRGTALAGDVLACLAMKVLASRQPGQKVFFLSRDGWLPWQLLDGVGTYVHVSRQALRLPLLAADPARAARWAIDPATNNSVASVLARLGATPEPFEGALAANGFSRDDWQLPLGRSARRRLATFIQSGTFRPHLHQVATEQGDKVSGYLRSQGLFDPAGGLIVDVGWNGSCHKHLQEWREREGVDPAPLGGVYLGLQTREGFAPGTRLEAVWEPGRTGGHLFELPPFYVLSEMFLTADHGGVLGYERSGGGVSPLLAPHDGSGALSHWGLREFQKEILDRARSRLGETGLDPALLSNGTAALFEAFATHPTPSEAIRYGQWPVCVDPAHGQAFSLAPSLDMRGMWNYFVHRLPQPVLWREAAAARLSGIRRLLFALANRADALACSARVILSRLRR